MTAESRATIGKKPRVYFVCEKDWLAGPAIYHIGVYWHRNLDAEHGEVAYLRWFLVAIRIKFKLWVDRGNWVRK